MLACIPAPWILWVINELAVLMLLELDLLVARPVLLGLSQVEAQSHPITWSHGWSSCSSRWRSPTLGKANDGDWPYKNRHCWGSSPVYSAKLPAVPAKIIIIQIPDYPFMSHTSNCHVPTMFQSFDPNFLQNHHLFILVHHKVLENPHLVPLSVLIFPIDRCSNVSPGGNTTGAARWLLRSTWPKPWRWVESTSRRPGYVGYIAIIMPWYRN